MFNWLKKNAPGAAGQTASGKDWAAMLEAMAEGVYVTDQRGGVVFINGAARAILGYRDEDVLGKSCHALFHHSKQDGTPSPKDRSPILQVLRTGTATRLTEEVFCLNDGRRLPMDCTATPINEHGVITGLIVAFSDAGSRLRVESDLKKVREEAQQVFQLVPSAVYTVDAQQRVTSWNRRAAEITGYSAEEVLGKPCSVFADLPCRKGCGLLDKDVPKPISCAECTIRCKDGMVRVISKNADVLRDDKGEVTGGIESFEDITERRVAEGQTKLLSVAAEQSPSSLVITDAGGRIEYVNPKFCKVTGYTSAEVLGLNPRVLKSGETPPEKYKEMWSAILAGGTWHGEFHNRKKNGELYWESASVTCIKDDRGRIIKFLAIKEDITARKIAEQMLAEQEATFRAITSSAQDAIILMDNDGNVSFWNEAAERVLGWKQAEVLGRNLHSLITPERFMEAHKKAFARFRSTGAGGAIGKTLELAAIRKDGSEIKIDLALSSVMLRGKWCAVGIIRDITERKLAEEKLRESQERLDLALRSANMGVWSYDLKTGLRAFDAKACELLGLAPVKFGGREEEFFGALHQDDVKGVKEALEATIKNGVPYAPEYRAVLPGGAVRHIKARGLLERGADGAPLRINGIIWDVTEARLAHEAIRASEDKFRGIFESFLDLYYQADMTGKITIVSPSVERLSGWTAQEAVGKNVAELYADPAERAGLLAELGKKGYVTGYEITLKKKDGLLIPVMVSSRLRLDDKGRPVAVEGTLRDMTEIKRTREELRKARDAAEAANRAKSDFLANMSHEIRTPMNSIIGMSEMLLDGSLDEEQRRHLQTIQRSADALLYIINDILDISKIEAGLLKIESEPYGPREVAESVAEMFAQRAAAKNLELILKVSTDMPAAVMGDGNRLRQILINLVGNAFKFTLKGQIKIGVELLRGGGPAWLLFSVADTGVGVSPENQKKLFRKFSQVDDSSTRKYGGTGLGLSISKALVEMMGGSFSLESAEGKGSVFSFRLPCEEAPYAPQPQAEHVSFTGLRALLVDDNQDSLEILSQNMATWGFITASAHNAQEGLEALKAGEKFDLLVVDHQMPGGDGEEFISRLRGSGAGEARIIMLSSRVEAVPDSVKPSVSAFLPKPITRSGLFNTILRVFRPKVLQEPAHAAEPEQVRDYSHLRILVAEDNVDNQNLVRMMLSRAGYSFDIAANGREALEKCAAFNYDLVFMDIQMPEMDGYEAAFQLRKTEAYKKTPIIALTAHGLDSDIRKSLSFGMNAHITKPLKKKVFYEALDKWLDTRRKVLVADDSADNLMLVEAFLKNEAGLRLYRASNGQEALELLKRNIFSLVLMDMEMPVMDGLTAVKALRAAAGGKAVPVVAFSAHDDAEKVKECLAAGCTDYLKKPVKKAALLEKLRKYLPAGGL